MDARLELLEQLKQQRLAQGNFLGLLNLLIGRRIEKVDGAAVSAGLTWRELAALLKKVRWEKEAAQELRLNTEALPVRDRERFWYFVITQSEVDSEKATLAGDALAQLLRTAGYAVGPPPGRTRG